MQSEIIKKMKTRHYDFFTVCIKCIAREYHIHWESSLELDCSEQGTFKARLLSFQTEERFFPKLMWGIESILIER